MTTQKSKVETLHEEITNLYSVDIQALYEIDGMGHVALQVLKSFTTTDRQELIEKLPEWSNKDLEVLAFVLHDDFSETYDDNFLLGYIFTLADDPLASSLLDQWLIFFFEENTVESIALLDSMLDRLERLRLNSYLGQNYLSILGCICNKFENEAIRFYPEKSASISNEGTKNNVPVLALLKSRIRS